MRTTLTTIALLAAVLTASADMMTGAARQQATPAGGYSCETIAEASAMTGTPMPGMAMAAGSPMADMDHMAMDIDLMYIDMMIPHHQSIVAMAEAARSRLTDERLIEIAEAIIAAQQPEIDELRGYRDAFYGAADPMPMDAAMMEAMNTMMPGMSGTMGEMAFQMDAAAQVAAICTAENVDLAFIDLTIPHHQMAIEASEALLAQSERPELRDFAQRVIETQQAEIDMLTEIRADLVGAATPANP